MRNFPSEKLDHLRNWRETYTQAKTFKSPQMDQAVMELREQFTALGVDLSDPNDFYIVWAATAVLLSNQSQLTEKGLSRMQAIETILAAMAASTPDQLHRDGR